MPQNKSPRPQRRQYDGFAAAIFAGSPLERIGITLGTGLVLFVMFVVYREAARGLRPIARAGRQRIVRPDSEPSYYKTNEEPTNDDEGARKARKYLPNTWVPNASHYMASTDGRTFCYFQEWTKESAHVIKATPFAMITNRKGDKRDAPPYTIISDKAYVTFKDEVGPAGKNPGPIVQAGLEGTVEISGPNNLKIRGRNFFFQREEMRIYSDNPVEIQADKHTATAKGIQIELIAEQKARSDEALAIAGVSSVKLLQDVNMVLVSAGDGQGGPGALPGLSKTAADKGPRIVRTHCDGSFVFYVESRIGIFERNVLIRRETSPGQFDALSADENVEITFEQKKPDAKKAPDAKDAAKSGLSTAAADKKPGATDAKTVAGNTDSTAKEPGAIDPNMTFKSVHARGKIVRLTSDVNDLKSQMREFTYDQTAREAKLVWIPRDTDRERTVRDPSGQLRKVPASANRVWVTQHGNLLRAQKIQLNHDPQGEVTHVMCLGEGEMQHVEEKTGLVDLAVYWHKEMRKYPDPDSTAFDLIHLEEALIEQPKDQSGIYADFIRLWLTRQNRGGQSARANQPPVAKQEQSGPHLDRMLAVRKVAMVSPQMECDTDHLEIWFENGPAAPGRGPVPQARKRANLVPTSDRIVRVAAPAGSGDAANVHAVPRNGSLNAVRAQPPSSSKTKSNPNDLFSTTGGSGDPYVLTAAKVLVHVVQGPEGQQAQVAYMLANDNVQLTQTHGDAADPLQVNGNVLEMHNRGELDQDMVVLGQPAHVRDRGAHIEGGRIVFNRLRSTADVVGPGRLQLPVQQTAGTEGEPPRTGEAPQPLDVEWHQKMHFDGKTAHFYVNVHTSMTDAQSQSDIRCLNMDVTLDKPFSFAQQQPQAETDRPAIETVFCKGDVEFESRANQVGHLAEVRRGTFMDLVFHKRTGKSTASGPGQLRVWRHNENGQSGISQFTNVHSNAPPKARKASSWEFEQVQFAGHMDGDFSDLLAGQSRPRPKSPPKVQPTAGPNSLLATSGAWTTVFHDHVEVIYGPVEQEMELVTRDELSEEAGCLLCEFLQVMQIPQAPTVAQHIEMLARGNARIEGKTFNGESDTITYDGSKTQYVLIGDSAGPARLWRQVKIGAERNMDLADRIKFNPVTHQVVQEGAKGFDLHQ